MRRLAGEWDGCSRDRQRGSVAVACPHLLVESLSLCPGTEANQTPTLLVLPCAIGRTQTDLHGYWSGALRTCAVFQAGVQALPDHHTPWSETPRPSKLAEVALAVWFRCVHPGHVYGLWALLCLLDKVRHRCAIGEV